MLRIAVLTLLIASAAQLMADGFRTSCVIIGHREGPVTLTCQFGENLNVSKNAFAVQRYGLDSYNTEPDDVLLGAWFTRDQLDYYVLQGYEFNGRASSTIVITMSRITQDYEGRYRCYVIPSVTELLDECVLKTSDLLPPPSTSTRHMDRTTKVSGDQDYQASSSSGMTVGAVVRGLPIAALTAVVTRLN